MNVLLTSGGWREDAWATAVPQILGAHGVNVIQARSGIEASNVIRSVTVHIAVVDLALPLDDSSIGSSEPAGARVLQLLRRLDAPPPVVVVRPPQPTLREASRGLVDALLDGLTANVDQQAALLSVTFEDHIAGCGVLCAHGADHQQNLRGLLIGHFENAPEDLTAFFSSRSEERELQPITNLKKV